MDTVKTQCFSQSFANLQGINRITQKVMPALTPCTEFRRLLTMSNWWDLFSTCTFLRSVQWAGLQRHVDDTLAKMWPTVCQLPRPESRSQPTVLDQTPCCIQKHSSSILGRYLRHLDFKLRHCLEMMLRKTGHKINNFLKRSIPNFSRTV